MWAKEDEGKQNIASIDTSALHNTSRYVRSYMANIEILQDTLTFVKAQHDWFARNVEDGSDYMSSPWFEITSDTMSSQLFQIKVILTWTKEVLERTQILIDLVGVSLPCSWIWVIVTLL